jgi:hypothetical protein
LYGRVALLCLSAEPFCGLVVYVVNRESCSYRYLSSGSRPVHGHRGHEWRGQNILRGRYWLASATCMASMRGLPARPVLSEVKDPRSSAPALGCGDTPARSAPPRGGGTCPIRLPHSARAPRPGPYRHCTPSLSRESGPAARRARHPSTPLGACGPRAPGSAHWARRGGRRSACPRLEEPVVARHLDVDVKAVDQRAGDALLVALHHAQRATNAVRLHLALGVAIVPTRAGILTNRHFSCGLR